MLNPLLKLAVLSGAQAVVQFHIQRGVDVNAMDGDSRSALMLAALKGTQKPVGYCFRPEPTRQRTQEWQRCPRSGARDGDSET